MSRKQVIQIKSLTDYLSKQKKPLTAQNTHATENKTQQFKIKTKTPKANN